MPGEAAGLARLALVSQPSAPMIATAVRWREFPRGASVAFRFGLLRWGDVNKGRQN